MKYSNYFFVFLCFRICLLLLFILSVVPNLRGQSNETIYYTNGSKIGTIDLETCDTTFLFELPFPWGANDLTFTREGILIGSHGHRISIIDWENQIFTPLPVIGNYGFSALTTDKDGRIIIAGTSNFGIVDPVTGAFTSLGPLPLELGQKGDLTFYKGRLLLSSRFGAPPINVLVEVNLDDPSASVILTELHFPGEILHGLVTIMDNCENQRVIIIGNFSNPLLYEINMEDYSLIPLCVPPHGFNGAALQTEYLASACDLLLDLDFDNSSGVPGFDWQDSIRCMPYDGPLCDEDVYVHAEARIDSLTVWLDGIPPDGNKEYLWFGGYPGLSASVSVGNVITLVNEGNVTHLDWEQAILGLRYRHDGPTYTAGPRHIDFVLHSAIREGDTVRTTLFVPDGMPWAGRDTTLSRCRNAGDVSMLDLLSPDVMSGGTFSTPDVYWQTALSPDTLLVSYIVTHPECPADTAWLTLMALEAPIVNLGPDQMLCHEEEFLLTTDGSASYTWQDGSTGASYLVTSPGTYAVTATLPNGCVTFDQVNISFSSPPNILDEGVVKLCPGDVHTWYGQEIVSPGVFAHEITGISGCDSLQYLLEVQFDSQPDATLSGDTIICAGNTVELVLSPGYTYQWSHGPTTAEVEIVQPGNYEVTVSDETSECIQVIKVEVKASPDINISAVEALAPTCPDDDEGTIVLGEVTGGQPPLTLQLGGDIIADNTSLSGYSPGEYTLEIQDALGCKRTVVITIPEAPGYGIVVPAEVIIEPGTITTITVSGILPFPVHYEWSPTSLIAWQEANRAGISAIESGLLNVLVTDGNGCMFEGVIRLIVKDNIVLYVPTAFSPNADGINDVWMPLPGGNREYFLSDLRIFDRWGNLLHESAGQAGVVGWAGMAKGKPCEAGVYVYMFSVSKPGGERNDYVGEIQLVR